MFKRPETALVSVCIRCFLLVLFIGYLSLNWTDQSFGDAIVFDNEAGGENAGNGRRSDFDDPLRNADDFSFAQSRTISGLEWTGTYSNDNTPPTLADFTVEIFANVESDAGDLPFKGAPLALFNLGNNVNRTDSGVNLGSLDVYEFSADIAFAADANTVYWVSLFDDTTSDSGDDFFWNWNTNLSGNAAQTTTPLNRPWTNLGNRFDFRLRGAAVPEPASALVLTAMGLGCVLKRRRRS